MFWYLDILGVKGSRMGSGCFGSLVTRGSVGDVGVTAKERLGSGGRGRTPGIEDQGIARDLWIQSLVSQG